MTILSTFDQTNTRVAEDALLVALSASNAPPLAGLIYPPYRRELRTHETPDGCIVCQLDKHGFRRYKRHRPLPKNPPPSANCDEIRAAFNAALAGFKVREVVDCGTFTKIFLEVSHGS